VGTQTAPVSGAATIQQRLPDRRVLCRVLVGFACATVSFLAGCSKSAEPPPFVAIEQEISPAPARVGPATVTLKLTDAGAKPITGAHFAIEADMSHPGMAPRLAEAKEAELGRYQAQLEFPMAGDWVILLHITLPGGKKLERQIDVRGVRPN
jgi:hypothetical protein